MRKFIVGLVGMTVVLGMGVHAEASVATQFAAALEAGDAAQVRALLAPTVQYTRLELVGAGKLHETPLATSKGDLPFLHDVDEVTVEQEGSASILRVIVNDDFVEEWEVWITTAGGNISALTEIAIEGSYPGAPDGCPDTSLRRREVATLHGPLGPYPQVHLRVWKTARNTDAWSFTEKKSCQPTPGLLLEDLEVVAHDGTSIVAYDHVGRLDRTIGGDGEGIALFHQLDGGPLTAGGVRLYSVGGEGYLFLSRTWFRRDLSQRDATYRVTQYALRGRSLQSVWGFDFGQTRGTETLLWHLAAPTVGAISARVIQGKSGCASGATMQLVASGRGFKVDRAGVPGACFAPRWPGGEGSMLARGDVDLKNIAQRAVAQHKRKEKKAPEVVRSYGDDDDEDEEGGMEAPVEESLVH
ncbi:MAG: hypothetical protein HYV02_06685 [Deltaproteobacteria bacterium]|nr:hypothetical protein [Deltaproteobacteria bacterium]